MEEIAKTNKKQLGVKITNAPLVFAAIFAALLIASSFIFSSVTKRIYNEWRKFEPTAFVEKVAYTCEEQVKFSGDNEFEYKFTRKDEKTGDIHSFYTKEKAKVGDTKEVYKVRVSKKGIGESTVIFNLDQLELAKKELSQKIENLSFDDYEHAILKVGTGDYGEVSEELLTAFWAYVGYFLFALALTAAIVVCLVFGTLKYFGLKK